MISRFILLLVLSLMLLLSLASKTDAFDDCAFAFDEYLCVCAGSISTIRVTGKATVPFKFVIATNCTILIENLRAPAISITTTTTTTGATTDWPFTVALNIDGFVCDAGESTTSSSCIEIAVPIIPSSRINITNVSATLRDMNAQRNFSLVRFNSTANGNAGNPLIIHLQNNSLSGKDLNIGEGSISFSLLHLARNVSQVSISVLDSFVDVSAPLVAANTLLLRAGGIIAEGALLDGGGTMSVANTDVSVKNIFLGANTALVVEARGILVQCASSLQGIILRKTSVLIAFVPPATWPASSSSSSSSLTLTAVVMEFSDRAPPPSSAALLELGGAGMTIFDCSASVTTSPSKVSLSIVVAVVARFLRGVAADGGGAVAGNAGSPYVSLSRNQVAVLNMKNAKSIDAGILQVDGGDLSLGSLEVSDSAVEVFFSFAQRGEYFVVNVHGGNVGVSFSVAVRRNRASLLPLAGSEIPYVLSPVARIAFRIFTITTSSTDGSSSAALSSYSSSFEGNAMNVDVPPRYSGTGAGERRRVEVTLAIVFILGGVLGELSFTGNGITGRVMAYSSTDFDTAGAVNMLFISDSISVSSWDGGQFLFAENSLNLDDVTDAHRVTLLNLPAIRTFGSGSFFADVTITVRSNRMTLPSCATRLSYLLFVALLHFAAAVELSWVGVLQLENNIMSISLSSSSSVTLGLMRSSSRRIDLNIVRAIGNKITDSSAEISPGTTMTRSVYFNFFHFIKLSVKSSILFAGNSVGIAIVGGRSTVFAGGFGPSPGMCIDAEFDQMICETSVAALRVLDNRFNISITNATVVGVTILALINQHPSLSSSPPWYGGSDPTLQTLLNETLQSGTSSSSWIPVIIGNQTITISSCAQKTTRVEFLRYSRSSSSSRDQTPNPGDSFLLKSNRVRVRSGCSGGGGVSNYSHASLGVQRPSDRSHVRWLGVQAVVVSGDIVDIDMMVEGANRLFVLSGPRDEDHVECFSAALLALDNVSVAVVASNHVAASRSITHLVQLSDLDASVRPPIVNGSSNSTMGLLVQDTVIHVLGQHASVFSICVLGNQLASVSSSSSSSTTLLLHHRLEILRSGIKGGGGGGAGSMNSSSSSSSMRIVALLFPAFGATLHVSGCFLAVLQFSASISSTTAGGGLLCLVDFAPRGLAAVGRQSLSSTSTMGQLVGAATALFRSVTLQDNRMEGIWSATDRLEVSLLRFCGCHQSAAGPAVLMLRNVIQGVDTAASSSVFSLMFVAPDRGGGGGEVTPLPAVTATSCTFSIERTELVDAPGCVDGGGCGMIDFAENLLLSADFNITDSRIHPGGAAAAVSFITLGGSSVFSSSPSSVRFWLSRNEMRGGAMSQSSFFAYDRSSSSSSSSSSGSGSNGVSLNHSSFAFHCNSFSPATATESTFLELWGARRDVSIAIDSRAVCMSLSPSVSLSRVSLTDSDTGGSRLPTPISFSRSSSTSVTHNEPSRTETATRTDGSLSSSASRPRTPTRTSTRTRSSSRSAKTPTRSPSPPSRTNSSEPSPTPSASLSAATESVPLLYNFPVVFPPGASAAVALLSALAAPSAAVFMQNLRALGAVGRCGENENLARLPPLSFDSNPLSMEIGAPYVYTREYRGALVGNALLITIFFVVQFISAVALLLARRHASLASALAAVRFPGLGIILLLVLVGPTAAAFGTVAAGARAASMGDVALAAAGLSTRLVMELLYSGAVCAVGPLVVLGYVAAWCQRNELLDAVKAAKLPRTAGVVRRAWTYVSHPWSAWRPGQFHNKYGDAYEPYGALSMMVVDYAVPVILGLAGGAVLQIKERSECFVAAVVVVVVTSLHFAAQILVRPFLNRLDTTVGLVSCLFELVGALFALLSVVGRKELVPLSDDLGLFCVVVALIGAAAAALPKFFRPFFRSVMRLVRRVRARAAGSKASRKKKKKITHKRTLRANLQEVVRENEEKEMMMMANRSAAAAASSSSSPHHNHENDDNHENLLSSPARTKKRSASRTEEPLLPPTTSGSFSPRAAADAAASPVSAAERPRRKKVLSHQKQV